MGRVKDLSNGQAVLKKKHKSKVNGTSMESNAKKLKMKKKIPKPKPTKQVQDSDDEMEAELSVPIVSTLKSKKLKKKVPSKKKSQTSAKAASDDSSDEEVTAKSHKQGLKNLKEIDKELFDFLQKNDKKLLEFNPDESSDEEIPTKAVEENNEVDEEMDSDGELVHKPSSKLEAASDESDLEEDEDGDDDDESGQKTITFNMLRKWQEKLESGKMDNTVIKSVVQAFNSALLSLTNDENAVPMYKVEGAGIFNGIIQMCVLHLLPAVRKFLGLEEHSKKLPHKCKKWNKVRNSLKTYILDITKLLENVSSNNILTVLLKHLHQLCPIVASSYGNICKPILKRLVTLWSQSEETVRVLSFLCILKITRGQPAMFLNTVLKVMYFSYVRNSKFVSPNTMPSINFMRRSLAEMFALDLNVSYTHVFLYIRQLAIHLRNAIILKKKDSFQSVYNWQFVNSMKLWSDVLSKTFDKPQLRPLIYPLVNICIGSIKLIPTAQFFPLRFHCLQVLVDLSCETNTFIPVLPLILEVLNSNTFNKKHSKVSMKPLSFSCILRLTKNQLGENGFRDEVIENVCGLALRYLAGESTHVSFPDLVVPTIIHLKKYIKTSKNSNHTRKLKTLCDKIEETSTLVERERSKLVVPLKEIHLNNNGVLKNIETPIQVYYRSWQNVHQTKKKREVTQSDDIADYNLPTLNKKPRIGESSKSDGPVELFPSDSDENDDEEQVEEKQKKKKKVKKMKPVEPQPEEEEDDDDDNYNHNHEDIIKDLDLDHWE